MLIPAKSSSMFFLAICLTLRGCSDLTPTNWAISNLLYIGAGTEM